MTWLERFKTPHWAALFIFFALSCALVPGLSSFGITWDEPSGYFRGVHRLFDWLGHLSDRATYWPLPDEQTAQRTHYFGHPPAVRYAGALAWALFHRWMEAIPSMRMGAVLLFSGSIAVLYLLVSENEGAWAGLFAALGLALMPRVLGQAFVLSSEAALLFFWIATSYVYLKYRTHKWGGVLAALPFGFLILAKFTGLVWLAPVLLFELVHARRIRLMFWGPLLVIGLTVAVLFNPTWWGHPCDGFWNHHVRLSLSLPHSLPITTYYRGSLGLPPWHYVPVMMLITTPVLITALFLVGLFCSMKMRPVNAFHLFCLFQFLTLLVLFSSPLSPKYDGIRLFIVLFIWVAALAGVGGKWIIEKWPAPSVRIVVLVLMSLLGVRAFQVHPFEFSYFNFLVGGAKGAEKRGFEATYFWEAANPAFCEQVNALLPLGVDVRVIPPYPEHFSFLQFAGFLRKDIHFVAEPARYLLLMTRQGQFSPDVWKIYRERTPLAKVSFEGVALMQLYDLSSDTGVPPAR